MILHEDAVNNFLHEMHMKKELTYENGHLPSKAFYINRRLMNILIAARGTRIHLYWLKDIR